tara:strand:- start:29 stop:442 length:414 start_codon:yes stop_codon:yes gene_type:complete
MSTLRTNALEGVDAKNSITIVAGTGNITTTNVQEGLMKGWLNLNGTGTIAILDSFNVSGITDDGTGQYIHTHSNPMNNALYSVALMSKRATSTNNSGITNQDGTFTTAAVRMLLSKFDNLSSHDAEMVFTQIAGDLA